MKVEEVKVEIIPHINNVRRHKEDRSYMSRILARYKGEWIATDISVSAPSPLISAANAIAEAKRQGLWK